MTNTEQIAAMAERIEKLEGALEEIAELTKGPLPWTLTQSRKNRATIYFRAKAALLSSGDQG